MKTSLKAANWARKAWRSPSAQPALAGFTAGLLLHLWLEAPRTHPGGCETGHQEMTSTPVAPLSAPGAPPTQTTLQAPVPSTLQTAPQAALAQALPEASPTPVRVWNTPDGKPALGAKSTVVYARPLESKQAIKLTEGVEITDGIDWEQQYSSALDRLGTKIQSAPALDRSRLRAQVDELIANGHRYFGERIQRSPRVQSSEQAILHTINAR